MNGIVAFLSDFGLSDSYVAEVKGAILSVSRELTIIDITHDCPPQDIRTGAYHLWRASESFPPETVFLGVVDPGVGSKRRGIVAKDSKHVFVGPDNGLFSWALGENARFFHLEKHPLGKDISLTFHARDLFGPIAGLIASQRIKPEECGKEIFDPVQLPQPKCEIKEHYVLCEVLSIDRFGNLIVFAKGLGTRFSEGQKVRVELGKTKVQAIYGPYASSDGFVVHDDSSGLFEIAYFKDSAARILCAKAGDEVKIWLD